MRSHKWLVTIAAFSVVILCAFGRYEGVQSGVGVASKPQNLLAIVGATLLDGSGKAAVKDAVVLIQGDTIKAVGRRGEINLPAGARVIDARGFVVAPGFIDAHSHSDRGFDEDPAKTRRPRPRYHRASQRWSLGRMVVRLSPSVNSSPNSTAIRWLSMYSRL